MNLRILFSLLLWLVCVANASGQIPCSTSTKLVCQVPFATGTTVGGGTVPPSVINAATGLNAPIAAQLSQLPAASSSSGLFTIVVNGVPKAVENLGPILTDSARTIGEGKIFLGFSFQQYTFNAINGISLGKVPFVYPATTPASTIWVQDLQHISFKYDQYVTQFTLGMTDKMDLSIIVPVNRVSIGVGNAAPQTQYTYDSATNQFLGSLTTNPPFVPGVASGLGDLLFSFKREFWQDQSERATFSAGLILRGPTGDALNYLGSGAWGFNPYAIFSYQARVTPHARLGYQWNTSSVLVNPTGGHQTLPGGLQFDVGADARIFKNVTVAGDIFGNQFLNSPTLVVSNAGSVKYTDPSGNPIQAPALVQPLPTVLAQNSSYTVSYFSVGLKWNPWKDVIFSGNVLIQMNNVGLRSDPVPLVGISYKFMP